MIFLVDTHVWLWLQVTPDRIAADVLDQLADPGNGLMFSAASAWEIAIKHALGRLPLPEPVADFVATRMLRSGVTALPITHAHAMRTAELPHHHRDPFDRILVAQAQHDSLTLVTSDRQLAAYDVDILWV